jgi:F-type H+-transporting ATPase subunit delta
MAELSTIARPYAQAAFALADETTSLQIWEDLLNALALISEDPALRSLSNNPNVSSQQLADLVVGLLDDTQISLHVANFVRLVSEHRRVLALPEIRTQFITLKNAREGIQDVEIVSAFPLDAQQQADLVASLEKSTRKKVLVRLSVDPQLICGVKILMGDKVIDASARAQLAALASTLRA